MSPPYPRAPLKMTILIDSFRPNYDLSAVGMRWMKSWCNWRIGLKPCRRSWRRSGLWFFHCVYVCFVGADGFGISMPKMAGQGAGGSCIGPRSIAATPAVRMLVVRRLAGFVCLSLCILSFLSFSLSPNLLTGLFWGP